MNKLRCLIKYYGHSEIVLGAYQVIDSCQLDIENNRDIEQIARDNMQRVCGDVKCIYYTITYINEQ